MDAENNRRLKKKRRNFICRERYQAKRGRFGRGTELDGDTFNYFLRVLEVNIKDFSTAEDREIFIDNVFEQTAGREMEISCNQLGSRAIETFLPWANYKILLRFTYAFSKDLRKICCHEFGSFVMQELIIAVSTFLQKSQRENPTPEEDEDAQSAAPDMTVRFKNWLQQVCKFVVNNLEEFVWDNYANHLIRTVLKCLSGLPLKPPVKEKKKKGEDKNLNFSVPLLDAEVLTSPLDEGFSLVQQCGCHILEMPQIFDSVYTNLISGLLQTVLQAVQKVHSKLCKKIVCHLVHTCFDPELEGNKNTGSIPEILKYSAGARLMDVMISVAKKKTFTKIYTCCFINQLQPLSLAPDANFCVQNLIKHCKQTAELESIFEKLSPNFETLLRNQKHGVILALGQACQRLCCKQGEFIKHLQAAFHCVETERRALFPLLVALLVDYETWCEISTDEQYCGALPVTVTGSVLVQTMLNFSEPIQIVRALQELEPKYLQKLLCTINGSRIGDVLFESKSIGAKMRGKFFNRLRGSLVALSVSKFGSWVLEKIWAWASLKDKKLILEELAASEAYVNGVSYGFKFAEKSGLSLFKRRPADWEESMTRKERTEKIFSDIIGP